MSYSFRFSRFDRCAVAVGVVVAAMPAFARAQTWNGYAGDAQHTALAPAPSQPLMGIHWSTPVDLAPQFSGPESELLIHYGSPLITAANTVIVPVKTQAAGTFELEAVDGATGNVKWMQPSDYLLPAQSGGQNYNWTPSYGPTLAGGNTVYYPGAGGTVYSRSMLDNNSMETPTQTPFYGTLATYEGSKSTYDSSVSISTPITADAQGDIYFGYQTSSSAPGGLSSGIARIGADGSKSYFPASSLMVGSSNAGMSQVVTNCAPAVSADGSKVYVAMSTGSFGSGRLVELNGSTLSQICSVALTDPKSGGNAPLPNDGTASPMIGPDGDVYMGVFDAANTSRGWMEHFSANLSMQKPTGGFGWDDTASVVPASMVPSYHGTSSYLLMTKYNNYAGTGGNGDNMIAILDPNATQVDTRYNSNGAGGATIMKEVLTITGPTLDDHKTAQFPGATDEWCINTAVVDPATDSVLVNNEDGNVYRWNLATNTLTEAVAMTGGLGEAYTSTVVGPDGTVYAINDAKLFAVGAVPSSWLHDADGVWSLKGNWSAGLPSGFGATANFLGAISADRTVTLDGPQMVGTMNFDSSSSYTIAGTSTLTIDLPEGDGAINVVSGSHTIGVPVVVNKNTTITVTQLSDTLTMSGGVSGGSAIGVTKAGAGTLAVTNVRVGGLTIHGGAVQVLADGSADGVSKVGSLGIDGGGQLDLTNNKLIVTSGGVGSWNGSNYDGVAGLIKAGRNGGSWDGSGIVTSQTAAGMASQLTTLAVAAAGDVDKTSFGGQSVAATDVLVMYTYAGDANLDGKINADDYFQIDSHYNNSADSAKSFLNGDFNYDGQINGDDYALIDASFAGQGAAFSSAPGLGAVASVPEPAGILALGVTGMGWLAQGRRRVGRRSGDLWV